MCVCVCVCVLCAAGRLQSDAAFGKPSLRPVELPKPPVLPLLQHADDVTLWEAQQRGDDVADAAGEAGASFGGGRPGGDGSSQQRDWGLRRD